MARRKAHTLSLDGYTVPPELLDPDHPAWASRASTLEVADRYALPYVEPGSDRYGRGAHPHNRRNRASQAWAVANGLTTLHRFADLNRLQAMGLFGPQDG